MAWGRRGIAASKPMCVSARVYTYVMLSARRRVLGLVSRDIRLNCRGGKERKDKLQDFRLREVRLTG